MYNPLNRGKPCVRLRIAADAEVHPPNIFAKIDDQTGALHMIDELFVRTTYGLREPNDLGLSRQR